MRRIALFILLFLPTLVLAQDAVMTPELLWSLGRVGALGTNPNADTLLYKVDKTDIETEKTTTELFFVDLTSRRAHKTHAFGKKRFVQWDHKGIYSREGGELFLSADQGKSWKKLLSGLDDAIDVRISPDGEWVAYSKEVLVEKTLAKEIYDDVPNSSTHIYTNLDYRHWDTWSSGRVNHVFVRKMNDASSGKDILGGKPYSCPQQPFGGKEDFVFTPDSKSIIFVTKEKTGKEYAQSTNTDIFKYDIASGKTVNLTEGMLGYDKSPTLNKSGRLTAWLSMERDGYEADKNDLVVMDLASGTKMNLTAGWDGTVDGDYLWAKDGKSIFFSASVKGTQQLFVVDVPKKIDGKQGATVQQLTQGNFNITNTVAQSENKLIVGRTDFNHATELFTVDVKSRIIDPLTAVNDSIYGSIKMGHSELRMVTTQDNKQMGVWVIYPPDFDPSKKYPTLLYCQGGPQSALSQFYSIRWNFQLMAANGYIIVAPNRRGMPGWGVEWNEAISKDWGGKPMQDYLDAIDAVSNEHYVDKGRLGCVGASFGGYSVFMLAGIHENRFKSFISHNGLFDMKSWYGTTEELWFANWDLGGNYWDSPVPESYKKFDPSNYVSQWNTPILIIQGGLDFRVPIEQGLEAFQAAQLRGIKSKLLYFPNENHWVLRPHNGLVWQREFFKWLKETL